MIDNGHEILFDDTMDTKKVPWMPFVLTTLWFDFGTLPIAEKKM